MNDGLNSPTTSLFRFRNSSQQRDTIHHISEPKEVQVHYHVEYDANTGRYVGLPKEWAHVQPDAPASEAPLGVSPLLSAKKLPHASGTSLITTSTGSHLRKEPSSTSIGGEPRLEFTSPGNLEIGKI
jgi:hypothetical protein